jgi:UDPglucose 6-dehydrogenase
MKEGATVTAFDPLAQAPIGLQITQSPSALEACEDSNALVILTEWPEFAEIKPEDVKSVLQNPAVILDTRRILDQASWSKVFSNFKTVGGS